jgi:hypothetical protein
MKLNEAQVEAIANADAHTNNACLPTYTDLHKTLLAVLEAGRGPSGRIILEVSQEAALLFRAIKVVNRLLKS